jgi:glycerophosphoryl diester phosphodiesterase
MRTDTIKLSDKKNTRVVAHRGVSGLETENTAAAFIAAGNRTHYGVETDIWRTADGRFLCNHDGRTGRICDVDLVIEQSSFDELRALTLRDKDGKSDRAELMLATPAEYRKICEKYGKHCVPELKSNFTEDEIRQILAIFDGYLENTTFIAFNIANLDLVRSVKPDQKCQFLAGSWNDDYPQMLAERRMDLDIAWTALTEERVKACHDRGIEVNCWTVDDPEKAAMLISWGVDYITSNILE